MAVLDVGPTDLALDRVTDGSPLSLRIDSPDEDASAWVVTAVVVDRVGGAGLSGCGRRQGRGPEQRGRQRHDDGERSQWFPQAHNCPSRLSSASATVPS